MSPWLSPTFMEGIKTSTIKWLAKNWFKVGIIFVVLIAIVAVFYSYQDHLERKTAAETWERLKKEEESKKEYVAERKTDCLDIYKTEGAKWNNVRSWRYDENVDLCYITYRESNPKSKAQCREDLDAQKAIFSPDLVPTNIFLSYLNCMEGNFENSF